LDAGLCGALFWVLEVELELWFVGLIGLLLEFAGLRLGWWGQGRFLVGLQVAVLLCHLILLCLRFRFLCFLLEEALLCILVVFGLRVLVLYFSAVSSTTGSGFNSSVLFSEDTGAGRVF
jgi:hypothetical protein